MILTRLCDPFAGSGSLLLAAAHYGSMVCGIEADYTTVHPYGKSSRVGQKKRARNETMAANLDQYNLTPFFVDLVMMNAFHSKAMVGTFDAIITDPPYGMREKIRYGGDCFIQDMLSLFNRLLIIDGLVAHIIPYSRHTQREWETVHASHERYGFRIEYAFEQAITTEMGRKIVLARKIRSINRTEFDSHLGCLPVATNLECTYEKLVSGGADPNTPLSS
ncbi:hypothetical protein ACOME3_010326 [Neoechinorhynchus agilis]